MESSIRQCGNNLNENETSSSSNNFAQIVQNVIKRCKMNPGECLKVNEIADAEGCEKRRLYDLFNVLCSVGLCFKTVDKMYIWYGEKNMMKTLKEEYLRAEVLTFSRDMWSIFIMPESPPIGHLALTIIIIYLFFGSKEMALKQICLIMAQRKAKMSRLLRRLYLAAFFLEQINVLSHTSQIGSYKILIDTDSIIQSAFDELKLRNYLPSLSVAAQLNRIDKSYVNDIQSIRNISLSNRIKQSHISIMPPIIQPITATNESTSNIETTKLTTTVTTNQFNQECKVPIIGIQPIHLVETY